MKTFIPETSLVNFAFNREHGRLTGASEMFGGSFPSEFVVKNYKTQRSLTFKPVQPGDKLFDQDQWDGVQQIYRPSDDSTPVKSLVLHHEF